MRKRRLASLLLAASLAASTLAGCGSGGKTETTAAAAGGQTEAAGSGTTGETGAAGGTSAADLGTPLADVRVRQALAYAIDMNAIVDSLFEGKAEVAKSFTAPGDWLNAGIPVYEYNPEKAKELLKEAGWRSGGPAVGTAGRYGEGSVSSEVGFSLCGSGSPCRERVL